MDSSASSDSVQPNIVTLLNSLSMANDQTEKCNLIAKLQECFIASKQEDILQADILDNILSYAHDSSSEVRKAVVTFIHQTCNANINLVHKAADILVILINDCSPQVIKKVLQVLIKIYGQFYELLVQSSSDTFEAMEHTWNQFSSIKSKTIEYLDNENDGIRTATVKFLEKVVLLQTYRGNSNKADNDMSLDDISANVKLVKRKKILEDEALNIFDALIKFHGTSHISSVNLIVVTGSLCNIAKARPNLLTSVLEALGSIIENFPLTLSTSQVNSVKKQIKQQLLNILKTPDIVDNQAHIIQYLLNLGYTIEEIKKNIPKTDKLTSQRSKRTLDSSVLQSSSKRFCVDVSQTENLYVESENSIAKIQKKTIKDKLNCLESVISLVDYGLQKLPNECPEIAKEDFTAFTDIPTSKTIVLGVLSTHQITARSEVDQQKNLEKKTSQISNKLKETLDRMKEDGKARKSKLKSKFESKLYDSLKPIPKKNKVELLKRSVKNISNYQFISQESELRKIQKILAVIYSTFIPEAKQIVLNDLSENVHNKIDLGLLCMYENFNLQQGFTRQSFDKIEEKQGLELIFNELLMMANTIDDESEKINILKTIYLHSPTLSNNHLQSLKDLVLHSSQFLPLMTFFKCIALRKASLSIPILNILKDLSELEDTLKSEAAVKIILEIYSLKSLLRPVVKEIALNQIKKLFGIDEHNQSEKEPQMYLRLGIELISDEPDILYKIIDVYVASPPHVKRIILKMIETPICKIEQDNPLLLKVIQYCSPGAETLITRIVYILTDKAAVSDELAKCVKSLYLTKINDVRLLIPILSKLSKSEIFEALPKIIKLSPLVVKEALNRIFIQNSSKSVTPSELFLQLHTLELNPTDVKFIIKAISICLSEKEVYTHEVIASVLQQMSNMNPLPTFLMRTVIQSLTLYPKLSGFVINLLQKLVLKQIWKQKLLWEGFLKCCQRVLPASLGVLVQIPPPQLLSALKICPELKQPLHEYAKSVNESGIGTIPKQILDILDEKTNNEDKIIEGLTENSEKIEPEPPGV